MIYVAAVFIRFAARQSDHCRGQNSHELAIRPLKFTFLQWALISVSVSLSPSSSLLSFFLSLCFLLGNEARRSFIHSHSFRCYRPFPQVPSEEIEY